MNLEDSTLAKTQILLGRDGVAGSGFYLQLCDLPKE